MIDSPFQPPTFPPDYTQPMTADPNTGKAVPGEAPVVAEVETPKAEAEVEPLIPDIPKPKPPIKPETHLDAMIRILGEYNNKETDIPLTSEYWKHRNDNLQK